MLWVGLNCGECRTGIAVGAKKVAGTEYNGNEEDLD